MTTFVAHDDDAIWGQGETEDAARTDAREWLLDAAQKRQESEESTVETILDAMVAELDVSEATPALLAKRERGGMGFETLKDGRLGTNEEADAEYDA